MSAQDGGAFLTGSTSRSGRERRVTGHAAERVDATCVTQECLSATSLCVFNLVSRAEDAPCRWCVRQRCARCGLRAWISEALLGAQRAWVHARDAGSYEYQILELAEWLKRDYSDKGLPQGLKCAKEGTSRARVHPLGRIASDHRPPA